MTDNDDERLEEVISCIRAGRCTPYCDSGALVVGALDRANRECQVWLEKLDASEEARQKAEAQRDRAVMALRAQGSMRFATGEWHTLLCNEYGHDHHYVGDTCEIARAVLAEVEAG